MAAPVIHRDSPTISPKTAQELNMRIKRTCTDFWIWLHCLGVSSAGTSGVSGTRTSTAAAPEISGWMKLMSSAGSALHDRWPWLQCVRTQRLGCKFKLCSQKEKVKITETLLYETRIKGKT